MCEFILSIGLFINNAANECPQSEREGEDDYRHI